MVGRIPGQESAIIRAFYGDLSVSSPRVKKPPVRGQVKNITTAFECQEISALVTLDWKLTAAACSGLGFGHTALG